MARRAEKQGWGVKTGGEKRKQVMGTHGGRVGCRLLRSQGRANISICLNVVYIQVECLPASDTNIVYYKWR